MITEFIAKNFNLGCPYSNLTKSSEFELDRYEQVADPETTTPNGCTCISLCETSIGANNFRYDWCKTKDECGKYYYFGSYYWDKFQYLTSSRPKFNSLSWNDKHAQTWSRIISDAAFGPYLNFAGFFTESVKTVFDNEWDEMPEGRHKFIHSVGAVCPFVVNVKDSPFTGIFQNGDVYGMMRLGSANPIKEDMEVVPGGGFKVFRSGKHSANFVLNAANFSSGNHNFFAVPISNHIPKDNGVPLLASVAIGLKFSQAQSNPTKVGLSDAATYDQDGNRVDNVVFPFKVVNRNILVILDKYSCNM